MGGVLWLSFPGHAGWGGDVGHMRLPQVPATPSSGFRTPANCLGFLLVDPCSGELALPG